MAGKENFTSVKINIKPAVIFQHVCICHNMLGLTHLVKIVCEIIFKKRSLIQNYNSINNFFLSEMHQDWAACSWMNYTSQNKKSS